MALLKSLEREAAMLTDPAAVSRFRHACEEASTWIRGPASSGAWAASCAGVTAGSDAHGFLLVRTAERVITVQTGGIRAAGLDQEIS